MSTIYYNNESTNGYTTGSDFPDDFSDVWGSSRKTIEEIAPSRITAFFYEGVPPVHNKYTPLNTNSGSALENNSNENVSIDSEPESESDNETYYDGVGVHNSNPEALEPASEHSTHCFSQFLAALRSFLVSFLIWSDKMNPFVNNRNAI